MGDQLQALDQVRSTAIDLDVPDYASATSEVNQAILEAFRRGGIPAPVPQREVRMLAARA